jgi:flavin-dependent dehydrogenase
MGVARPGHIGRVVRRVEFDAALADAARAAGVELREGVKLLDATAEGRVITDQGELQAAAVVGADGVGSAVRRAMGLHAGLWRAMVLEVDTPPVAGDPDRDLIHFDARDRALAGYYWDFPTRVDGEALVCRGVYLLRPRSTGGTGLPADDSAELDRRLGAWLGEKGLSLQGLKKKRFAERGYAPREAVVDGRRLLVGEAAGIDPISGEGIAQAIEGGARLARLLAAWDGDPRGLRAWGPALRRGRLGLDLRARAAMVPWFYGQRRAALEAGFAGSPDLLHAGALHWAGRRAPLPALARGLLRGAWAALTRR